MSEIAMASIVISDLNTRKNLEAGTEDAGLDELARSIERQGLISPPTLRPMPDGRFEVISGQRRILAMQKLGYEKVPAVVREVSDQEAIAVSLVENVQRADMHPLDKARAFRALEELHGSVKAVSEHTGVGSCHFPRSMRTAGTSDSVG